MSLCTSESIFFFFLPATRYNKKKSIYIYSYMKKNEMIKSKKYFYQFLGFWRYSYYMKNIFCFVTIRKIFRCPHLTGPTCIVKYFAFHNNNFLASFYFFQLRVIKMIYLYSKESTENTEIWVGRLRIALLCTLLHYCLYYYISFIMC